MKPFMTLAEIPQTRQAEEAENKVKIKENNRSWSSHRIRISGFLNFQKDYLEQISQR